MNCNRAHDGQAVGTWITVTIWTFYWRNENGRRKTLSK